MLLNWRKAAVGGWCLGMLTVASLGGGCVVHARGGFAQVDVVDEQGYHHRGYYDDQHAWHGGWYDGGHAWHDDPPDWHH
ncbi:MAG: hypothetical protein ABSF29_13165 [Tepidisphaeraceae bacterium]|jgi:hypothetical protein